MSEASEIFHELLLGEGALFGLVLLIGIVVVIALVSREGAIAMIPVSIIISVFYFANVSGSNNLMWAGVIFLVLPFFFAFRAARAKD